MVYQLKEGKTNNVNVLTLQIILRYEIPGNNDLLKSYKYLKYG